MVWRDHLMVLCYSMPYSKSSKSWLHFVTIRRPIQQSIFGSQKTKDRIPKFESTKTIVLHDHFQVWHVKNKQLLRALLLLEEGAASYCQRLPLPFTSSVPLHLYWKNSGQKVILKHWSLLSQLNLGSCCCCL